MPSVVTFSAIVASTQPVAKYPGVRFMPEVMEALAAGLRSGALPLLFEHDASQAVAGRVLDARVIPIAGDDVAVKATFEIDADAWRAIEEGFAAAGVDGGFSFAVTTPQAPPASGLPAQVTLAADAAAWTDDERDEARALLDAFVPTESELLFQLSAVEDVATVYLALAKDVGMGVLGSAAYDAIKQLVRSRRSGTTRIEIHRTAPDGSTVKAIVVTDDPAVAEIALRTLPPDQSQAVIGFDDDWTWPSS